MADFYSLAMEDDEPSAQEMAQALAAQLRGQQQWGNLGLLTGDKVLSRFGQAQLQGAGQQEGLLAGAGQARSGRRLQKALAAEAARRAEAGAQRAESNAQRARTWDVQDRAGQQGFQAEQNALARQAQLDAAAIARGEKATEKGEQRLEADVLKAGTDLEGTAGLKDDLALLDKLTQQDDIPGVGRWDARKPELFYSPADTQYVQAARGIVGRLIKEQSGSAASEQEVQRKMEELGILGTSEQGAREGLKRLQRDAQAALGRRQAKYRPEVLQEYRARGGTLAEDLGPAQPQAAAPAGAPAVGPEEAAALQWVRDNPDDPRVPAILKRLGVAK